LSNKTGLLSSWLASPLSAATCLSEPDVSVTICATQLVVILYDRVWAWPRRSNVASHERKAFALNLTS
jgi:hypothetical protein